MSDSSGSLWTRKEKIIILIGAVLAALVGGIFWLLYFAGATGERHMVRFAGICLIGLGLLIMVFVGKLKPLSVYPHKHWRNYLRYLVAPGKIAGGLLLVIVGSASEALFYFGIGLVVLSMLYLNVIAYAYAKHKQESAPHLAGEREI